ncbi:IclR family transcriptional regulator C-terminal domain-containing protein [Streptomyces sp. NPDC127117]|uniref:IclR family transcriptional regulator domain-containing protein n=1 Tax=Streptomyces sp. NPDC127117 TaxID=3345368 RepID=UPI00362F544D
MFCLCHFGGPSAPRSCALTGLTAPLHSTAMGKALPSGPAAGEVRALMGAHHPAYTPTLTAVDALFDSLDEVRSRGYATEVEEPAIGRACLAAPVRDRSGRIHASISVSGSLSAMDTTSLSSVLRPPSSVVRPPLSVRAAVAPLLAHDRAVLAPTLIGRCAHLGESKLQHAGSSFVYCDCGSP